MCCDNSPRCCSLLTSLLGVLLSQSPSGPSLPFINCQSHILFTLFRLSLWAPAALLRTHLLLHPTQPITLGITPLSAPKPLHSLLWAFPSVSDLPHAHWQEQRFDSSSAPHPPQQAPTHTSSANRDSPSTPGGHNGSILTPKVKPAGAYSPALGPNAST